MLSTKYHNAAESNTAFMVKIEDLVREIMVQNDILYYRIESVMEHRPHLDGDDKFLPVIRVVTYFEDTVGQASDILRSEFDMDSEKSINKKKIRIDSFSYKHYQYTAWLKSNRRDLTEYKRLGNKRFELQLCSMLQDAWAGMEKELGYDNKSVPDEAKRDFYRVGALLEMADLEFLKIRSQHKNDNIDYSNYTYPAQPVEAEKQEEPVAAAPVTTFAEHLQAVAKEVPAPVAAPQPVPQAVPQPAPQPQFIVPPVVAAPVAPIVEAVKEVVIPQVVVPPVAPIVEAVKEVVIPQVVVPPVVAAPVAPIVEAVKEVVIPQVVVPPVVAAPVAPIVEAVKEVVIPQVVVPPVVAAPVAPIVEAVKEVVIPQVVVPPVVTAPVAPIVEAVKEAPITEFVVSPQHFAPQVAQTPEPTPAPVFEVPAAPVVNIVTPPVAPQPAPVAEVKPQAPVAPAAPVAEVPQPKVAPDTIAPVAAAIYNERVQQNVSSSLNIDASGTINKNTEAAREQAAPFFEDVIPKTAKPAILDENAPMTDVTLKEYVVNSKLLKEIDQKIAERAGARINSDIDIEGDVERLRFLKVYTLKQLHDRLIDNKDDVVSFAEKWIGKDNGGSFDSGISLFYLEYLLVGKRNDPAFAVEYVVKFISDNDYSARYIIPTYNSIRNNEVSNFSHLTIRA